MRDPVNTTRTNSPLYAVPEPLIFFQYFQPRFRDLRSTPFTMKMFLIDWISFFYCSCNFCINPSLQVWRLWKVFRDWRSDWRMIIKFVNIPTMLPLEFCKGEIALDMQLAVTSLGSTQILIDALRDWAGPCQDSDRILEKSSWQSINPKIVVFQFIRITEALFWWSQSPDDAHLN